jgi:putative NADPH-quinone reductase
MKEILEPGSDARVKIQIVWAHPRTDSLTSRVVAGLKYEASKKGIEVAELDLYRSGFDPILREDDEPDWTNPQKIYSKEVMKLSASISDFDHIVFVFPVWWYSLPAMLKGYIDRVWNYGLAYGDGKKLSVSSVSWIALVGGAKKNFEKHQKNNYMEDLLNNGISKYCGVNKSSVMFLYNTIAFEEGIEDSEKHYAALISQAKNIISEFV